MKRIVVFCGSSLGNEAQFEQGATALGKVLTRQNIGLVYGGAKVGLMGAMADTVLEHRGEVIGVIPTFLSSKEIAHDGLTELVLVKSMHERKAKMLELGDGMIAMPGGFGTLEELFEVLTWAQLGLHQKPIGLLNTGGYFNALLKMANQMVDSGFLKPEHRAMLLESTDPETLIDQMKAYQAPEAPKWLKNTEQS